MGMADRSTTVTTKLSMQECKRIFRDAANAPLLGSGNVAKLATVIGRVRSEFFTPQATPLSDLDDNPPDFSVGCQWSTRPPIILHMYIWEDEDHRVVQFVSPRKAGVRSNVVRRFTDPIVEADPAARIQIG